MRLVAVAILLLAVALVALAALLWLNRRRAAAPRPHGEWEPRFENGRVEIVREGETPVLIDEISGYGAEAQDRLAGAIEAARDEADARNRALQRATQR